MTGHSISGRPIRSIWCRGNESRSTAARRMGDRVAVIFAEPGKTDRLIEQHCQDQMVRSGSRRCPAFASGSTAVLQSRRIVPRNDRRDAAHDAASQDRFRHQSRGRASSRDDRKRPREAHIGESWIMPPRTFSVSAPKESRRWSSHSSDLTSARASSNTTIAVFSLKRNGDF